MGRFSACWEPTAGKTTTINLFLNFLQPTAGQALINGLDVSREGLKSKNYLAYIPENLQLYPNLSGLENLAYFSGIAGKDYKKEELEGFLSEADLQAHDLFRARENGTHIGIMREGWLLETLQAGDVNHNELEKRYLTHHPGLYLMVRFIMVTAKVCKG